MLKEAIEAIQEMAVEAAGTKKALPEIREVNGVTYIGPDARMLVPPRPMLLECNTLSGFVDYVVNNRDDLTNLMIHVVSPVRVDLIGKLDPLGLRACYCRAQCSTTGFRFGEVYDPEMFIIALMTQFQDSEGRKAILALAGNMRGERVVTSEDDGVTQSVGVRAGIALVSKRTIENPYNLAPKRTFAEIVQPISPFVFRVHQGKDGEVPRPALYEVDGGEWKIAAMGAIKGWLQSALAGSNIPGLQTPLPGSSIPVLA